MRSILILILILIFIAGCTSQSRIPEEPKIDEYTLLKVVFDKNIIDRSEEELPKTKQIFIYDTETFSLDYNTSQKICFEYDDQIIQIKTFMEPIAKPDDVSSHKLAYNIYCYDMGIPKPLKFRNFEIIKLKNNAPTEVFIHEIIQESDFNPHHFPSDTKINAKKELYFFATGIPPACNDNITSWKKTINNTTTYCIGQKNANDGKCIAQKTTLCLEEEYFKEINKILKETTREKERPDHFITATLCNEQKCETFSTPHKDYLPLGSVVNCILDDGRHIVAVCNAPFITKEGCEILNSRIIKLGDKRCTIQ